MKPHIIAFVFLAAFILVLGWHYFILVLDWHYFVMVFALLSLLLLLCLFGILCPLADLVQFLVYTFDVAKFIHLLDFYILLLRHYILHSIPLGFLDTLLYKFETPINNLLISVAVVRPLKQNEQLPPIERVV